MPKYKHFLFVTNNYDLGQQISKDLWERRKSWCIVSTDNIYDYDVKNFMNNSDYKLMIITDTNAIMAKKVNDFINFCNKYKVLPIFITKKSDYEVDLAHLMYSNIEDIMLDSFEYIHNDENDYSFPDLSDSEEIDEYQYMLDLLTEYLW